MVKPHAPLCCVVQIEERRSGVKYFDPGDKNGPTLLNHGRQRYTIKFGGMKRNLKAHVTCCATGHDVHFTAEGSWAEHRMTAVGSSRQMWRCSTGNGSGRASQQECREGAQDVSQDGEQSPSLSRRRWRDPVDGTRNACRSTVRIKLGVGLA